LGIPVSSSATIGLKGLRGVDRFYAVVGFADFVAVRIIPSSFIDSGPNRSARMQPRAS